jgi:HK97 gp10 family phage protein
VTTVRLDDAAIRALSASPEVKDALDSIGDQVRERATASAPRRTGEGAASIDYESGVDAYGAFVNVGWDNDHFYMLFVEVGTSRMPARPFLRPALEGDYTP